MAFLPFHRINYLISTLSIVTLNSTSAILNGGPLRYMKSAGNAGDGGLTKVYSSPGYFQFPDWRGELYSGVYRA